MTKEQILNICKRIEENKATEEELCAIRDVALARSETGTFNDGIEASAQMVECEAATPKLTEKEMHNRFRQVAEHIRALKHAAPQVATCGNTVAGESSDSGPAESASLDSSIAVVNSGLDVLEWKDTQRCVELPFIVEYRRKPEEGFSHWKAMAAFDFEGPAEAYAKQCYSETGPWEYRVRPPSERLERP